MQNTILQSKVLAYATSLAFFMAGISYLMLDDLFAGLFSGIFVFAAYILAKKLYPSFERKRKERLVEKGLPILLNSLALQLSLGLQFDAALKNAASRAKGMLKAELSAIDLELRSGKGMLECLRALQSKFLSSDIKRAISTLIYVYEHGNRNEQDIRPLKNLEKELQTKQGHELKRFNAKLSVISLFIVVFAAIIPAMFQAFVIIGSFAIDLNLSVEHMFGIITVLFPAINAMLLLYVSTMAPVALK